MPEMPISGVRSQLLPLQGALSTRSLPPPASTVGWLASIARAGSLTALGRYGVTGPATETLASGVNADAGPAASITTSDNSRPTRTARGLRRMGPPLDRQRPVLLYQTKRTAGNARYTVFFG